MPDSSTHYVIRVKHLRWFAAVALAVLAAVVAITSAGASNSDEILADTGDGRINVVHHFGGDALYCVDGNFNPINALSADMERGGGFQLLNMRGEPLWFVPARAVLARIVRAQRGGDHLLVAEGQGSYGPVALYVYRPTNGTIRFIFTGMDEHGKTNQMDFQGCQPINPPAGPGLCTMSRVNATVRNRNVRGFLRCYRLTCGGVDITDLPASRDCFCARYPSSLACKIAFK